MKRYIFHYSFILMAISLAGELYFHPIGAGIRVSFATPFFFFFLLFSRIFHPVWGGMITGFTVCLFRISLAMIIDGFSFNGAFFAHYPVFFYYFSFGLLFKFFHVKDHFKNLILVGSLGAIIEIMASLIELTFRGSFPIDSSSFLLLVVIAFVRSFFALGFFILILLREAMNENEAQFERNGQLLTLLSDLNVELTVINKSIQNAEEITRNCYQLYRNLKDSEETQYSRQALEIAGKIHEIKKDQQRIYAGLSKTAKNGQIADYISMEDLMLMIVKSNDAYAKSLNKSISITYKIDRNHPLIHSSLLLSILNNLVANSIEAINQKGIITITVHQEKLNTYMYVKDTGPGISKRNKEFIFEPGFTTKYNEAGHASNGIGLTHIKDVIESLDGSIQIIDQTGEYRTIFEVCLPTSKMTERNG